MTRPVHPGAKLTIADWIERWARERPQSPAVLYEDRIVTYRRARRGRQPLRALGAARRACARAMSSRC